MYPDVNKVLDKPKHFIYNIKDDVCAIGKKKNKRREGDGDTTGKMSLFGGTMGLLETKRWCACEYVCVEMIQPVLSPHQNCLERKTFIYDTKFIFSLLPFEWILFNGSFYFGKGPGEGGGIGACVSRSIQ